MTSGYFKERERERRKKRQFCVSGEKIMERRGRKIYECFSESIFKMCGWMYRWIKTIKIIIYTSKNIYIRGETDRQGQMPGIGTKRGLTQNTTAKNWNRWNCSPFPSLAPALYICTLFFLCILYFFILFFGHINAIWKK